jgi:hypothetical protein
MYHAGTRRVGPLTTCSLIFLFFLQLDYFFLFSIGAIRSNPFTISYILLYLELTNLLDELSRQTTRQTTEALDETEITRRRPKTESPIVLCDQILRVGSVFRFRTSFPPFTHRHLLTVSWLSDMFYIARSSSIT